MLSRPTLDALGFNKAARRIHGNPRLNVVGDWGDIFSNVGDDLTKALDQATPVLVNEALGLPKSGSTQVPTGYQTTPTGQIIPKAASSPPVTNWLVPIAIGGIILLMVMKK